MINRLKEIWRNYGTDKFDHDFLDFYDNILKNIRTIRNVLEIWVYNWASIRMWRDYFKWSAKILWVDINPAMDIPWATIVRADATTQEFANFAGYVDLVIDDWSHKSSDQIKSFELLRSILSPGWIYILEDVHTSFMPEYKDTEISAYDYLKDFSEKNCNEKYIEHRKNIETHESWTLVLFKNRE